MNKRGLSHALDHHAVGELDEAAHSRTTSILGHAVRSPFPEAVPLRHRSLRRDEPGRRGQSQRPGSPLRGLGSQEWMAVRVGSSVRDDAACACS